MKNLQETNEKLQFPLKIHPLTTKSELSWKLNQVLHFLGQLVVVQFHNPQAATLTLAH